MQNPELVIVGDEAWTREAWEARQRRLERDRERYHADPERRLKVMARVSRWHQANRERVREHKRRWIERNVPRVIGTLHDLACTGPTRATGCVCRKVTCYDKPRRLEPDR